jgi:uncharacterized protein YjiS (DUF1127 family)
MFHSNGRKAPGLLARMRHRRRCRRAEESLLALDDHTLRDIGFTRDTVRESAWQALRPDAPSSTRDDYRPPRFSVAAFVAACVGASTAAAGATDFESLPTVDDLPAGTVKVSPFIAGMGEHWADPRDLPLGPIYCVMKGRVVCAEFMVAQQDLVDGRSFEHLKLGLAETMPAIDHVELTHMPHGHEGYETPHYDLHMYFISLRERFAAEAPRTP